MMRPGVDIGDCTLCMGCVEVCPQVFVLNEATGYIEVVDRDDYALECIEEAIKYCPEDVIAWEDE